MYKVVIRNVYFSSPFHIQLFNYKSYQILTFIFVMSMVENIYFDVHIIAITHLKSSILEPSSVRTTGPIHFIYIY
jgi:hypothetical protein